MASFSIKRITVMRYRSVIVSSILSIAAASLVAKAAWFYPTGHLWAIVGLAIFIVLTVMDDFQIYVMYREIHPKAADGNDLLRKSLNGAILAHRWGSTLFALLCIAVFEFSRSHR